MTSFLLFTIRFLDSVPQYHGRNDEGEPKWPPSPLRFYQAMVGAAATRWRENQFRDSARPALRWLESQSIVILVPKVATQTFGFRMYGPNNSGDLMTAAWARGDIETSMAKFRVEKDVRPIQLQVDALHFLVSLSEPFKHRDVLTAAARSITHLGWGVDMVAADASIITAEEAAALPGERWSPSPGGGTPSRVPKAGTLDDLIARHDKFPHRLDGGGFKPVPPLAAFDIVHYRRSTDTPAKHWAAFQILDSEGGG